jgi:hypothetical protein
VRADRSIVHTWNLGMPSEAEPYTLVQVTRSTRVQVLTGNAALGDPGMKARFADLGGGVPGLDRRI